MNHGNRNKLMRVPVAPENIRYACNTCEYVYLRGPKKGTRCSSRTSKGLLRCSRHKPKDLVKKTPLGDDEIKDLCDEMMTLGETPIDDGCNVVDLEEYSVPLMSVEGVVSSLSELGGEASGNMRDISSMNKDMCVAGDTNSQEKLCAALSIVNMMDIPNYTTMTSPDTNVIVLMLDPLNIDGRESQPTNGVENLDDFQGQVDGGVVVPKDLMINPAKTLIDISMYDPSKMMSTKEYNLLSEISEMIDFMIFSPLSKDLVIYTRCMEFMNIANVDDQPHPYETWGYFDRIREMHRQMGTDVCVQCE